LYRKHKGNTQTQQAKNTQSKSTAVRQRRSLLDDTHCHRQPPNSRLVVLNPRHHHAWPKKVGCDPHARPREQSSLARDCHAPSSDVRHDHNFRQLERRMTVIAARRRVSTGNQRRCIDLASKNWKKMKVWPEHPPSTT